MIRAKITEKKVEELIKKGASVPSSKIENVLIKETKNVQLRIPLYLIKEIDRLREEREKNRLESRKSRHDFFLDAIIKAVNSGFDELKKK